MKMTHDAQEFPPVTPQDSGNITHGVGSGQRTGLGNNMSPEEAGVRPEDSAVKTKEAPRPNTDAPVTDPRDSGVITNGVKESLQVETPMPLPQDSSDVNLSGVDDDSTARGGAPINHFQE